MRKVAKPRRHAVAAWVNGEELAVIIRAAGGSVSAWARKVLMEAAGRESK